MAKIYHLSKEALKKYKEEYKKLKEEIKKKRAQMKENRDDLWRPEDLNCDYEPLESELISMEIRLKELENILKNSREIKNNSSKTHKKVTTGSTVTLEINGKLEKFTIVETLEANPTEGKISNESPVGKALLGKKSGDKVTVSSSIKKVYIIKKIE
jgi:transcription elongation factor GreA